MDTRSISLSLAVILAIGLLAAAPLAESPSGPGFHFETVETDAGPVQGVIYRPRGLDDSKPAPTIVFLNGYGECGVDGSRHLTVGLPPAVMRQPDRWPFVIVMPQKPSNQTEWEDYDDAVLEFIDIAARKYGADPKRVGITGLSQGGHGTIAIASRHPDRFLAAAPVCGYIEPWRASGRAKTKPTSPTSPEAIQAADALASMPVWLFHGERDRVVVPAESRTLHALLQERDSESKLTIFPNDDHNSWDSAYRQSTLWKWFQEHLAR